MTELPDILPRHVAIIMDGNGRWARRRGLERTEGHKSGAESARTIAQCCLDWGIPFLTVYAFSTENWRRPAAEVRFLMEGLERALRQYRDEVAGRNVRVKAIGEVGELPSRIVRELRHTEEATAGCDALTVVVALNYGSHREITEAVRAIARLVSRGELEPDRIDEQTVESHLYTAGLPPPDLLIRTAGEMRLSNFLLWQLSYTEIYVTETLWPDFREAQFLEALREFARRERRFGMVSEQARAARLSARRAAGPGRRDAN